MYDLKGLAMDKIDTHVSMLLRQVGSVCCLIYH